MESCLVIPNLIPRDAISEGGSTLIIIAPGQFDLQLATISAGQFNTVTIPSVFSFRQIPFGIR